MQAQPNRTMIAEILATGEEIRTGTLVDSNSARIAEQMENASEKVMRFNAVGDDLVQLTAVLLEIGRRADVAVVTDGLAAKALNRQGVQQILGRRLVSLADEGQEALPDAWLGEDRQFETPANILEEHGLVEALEIDQALGTKNRRWQRLYGLHELFTIQGTLKPQILGPQAHFGIRGMAGSNVVMCGSRRRFFPVYVKTGRILHIKNQSRV